MCVKQEKMWLHAVTQQLLEEVRSRVIDIKVNKVNPPGVFFLNALHYGSHRQAGTTPKSEEFDQLRLPGNQLHRVRIGGSQPDTYPGRRR